MAGTVEIRNARETDCHAIASLLTELHHEEGNHVIAHADVMATALFTAGREVNVSALVAVSDDQIVGTLLYYPGYDTLSASYGHHLADIIVTKTMRGQGIGKSLVRALAEVTLDAQKEWVSLTVLTRNDAAQQFYKALGMTRIDVHFFAAGKQALSSMWASAR